MFSLQWNNDKAQICFSLVIKRTAIIQNIYWYNTFIPKLCVNNSFHQEERLTCQIRILIIFIIFLVNNVLSLYARSSKYVINNERLRFDREEKWKTYQSRCLASAIKKKKKHKKKEIKREREREDIIIIFYR